jgi:antitoxin ChpS
MNQVQVRKQGGAAIVTIPADLLKLIHAEVGTTMDLDVVDGALVARPRLPNTPRRYTLEELMRGVTPVMIESLAKDTEWFRESDAVGREIA